MKILLVEDATNRIKFFINTFGNHDLVITENADSAIDYLSEEVFQYIFLDHDLGENNGCGADIASHLHSHPKNLNNHAKIIIHSWNIPASRSMLAMLPDALHIPFDKELFSKMTLTNQN